MKKVKDALGKPTPKSGPWAVWIWNQHISRKALTEQLNDFIKNGFGGVAIRPCRDMKPEYMSEEYLANLQCVFEIAKAAGIGVRLADDFSLPFNNFFEPIAQKKSSFCAQQLILEHVEVIQDKTAFSRSSIDPALHIILAAKLKDERIVLQSVKSLVEEKGSEGTVSFKAAGGDWQIMVFRKSFVTEPDGHFVPNVFNAQAAHTYCAEILEKLWARFSKFAPATFEGLVTEIPAYLPADNTIPWDNDLAAKYHSKYHKDLIRQLPILFFESDDLSAATRGEFYTFMAQIMYERFASVLESWVKKHRISQWTLIPERNVFSANNALRDCLALTSQPLSWAGVQAQDGTEENYQILRAVADTNTLQFRRGTVAIIGRSKVCAASTLQSLKTEIDLLAFNGYSRTLIDGCFFNLDHRSHIRTPFNPSWYSPCKDNIHKLTAYSSRLSQLVQGVQFSRPAAIINPVSSLLADYLPGNSEILRRGLGIIQKTVAELQRLTIDYDIITESFFAACTIRTNGEFGTANRIRKGNYQVAIIPYCRLISKSVLCQLEKLVIRKGTVIFIGEPPQGTLEDGVSQTITRRIEKLIGSHRDTVHVIPPKEMGPFLKHIDPAAKVSVGGKRCPEIYSASGSSTGFDIHLIHNMADRRDFFATVQIPSGKYIYIADCENGELAELKNVKHEGKLSSIDISFAPRATYVLIASSVSVPPAKSPAIVKTCLLPRNYRVVLKDQWSFTPDSLNVLPLTNWNTRIGLSRESGGFSHYCEAYFEAREIPEIGIFSLCDRAASGPYSDKAGKTFEVSINGNVVEPFRAGLADEAYAPVAARIAAFCGPLVAKYDIKNFIVKGFNRVSIRTVSLTGDPETILYPPFVAGTFSIVKGARGWTIDKPSSAVGYDSWTKYGFPYLSGSGTYRQDFELPAEYKRIVLKFSQTSGPVTVRLNQKDLGTFLWHPMEVDITSACEQRRNNIEVQVMNTMDNLIRMNGRQSGLTGEVYLDVY